MRHSMLVAAVAVVVVVGCHGDAPALPAPPVTQTRTGHYCNLGVFTPEEWARHKALVPQLAAATLDRTELPDGYAFRFAGTFKEIGAWLDGVRRCCPTVTFQVEFPPQSAVATMRISGSDDAKSFIREEFAALIGAHT